MTTGKRAPYPRLLGDVGGTHIRFGWAVGPGEGLIGMKAYRWVDVAGMEALVAAYLEDFGFPAPRAGALSIAGPIDGDQVSLTNRGWSFSTDALRQRLDLERLDVLNDFAALALAVPLLPPGSIRAIGAGDSAPGEPMAVLGAGTGLGVSASVVASTGRCVLASEGGHVSLCSGDATEDRLLAILRQWFGHVSFERVLSGPGIVNLYRANCAMAGVEPSSHDAEAVASLAAQSLDECCVAAMEQFFGFLGSFAGNMALTFNARGGVFLGGGIVPRWLERIEESSFRERFESKGRFRPYLERISTGVIVDPAAAALLGANLALDERPRIP